MVSHMIQNSGARSKKRFTKMCDKVYKYNDLLDIIHDPPLPTPLAAKWLHHVSTKFQSNERRSGFHKLHVSRSWCTLPKAVATYRIGCKALRLDCGKTDPGKLANALEVGVLPGQQGLNILGADLVLQSDRQTGATS